jgi:N-methylhydantoinase A
LVADVALDYSRSVLSLVTDEMPETLNSMLAEMEATARQDLLREGIDNTHMLLRPLADMRYQGQAYELTVPFTPDLIGAFHATHERTYGHAMQERRVEVVNLRLVAVGMVDKPAFEPETISIRQEAKSVEQRRDGVILYERDRLQPGDLLTSPALIFQLDSTTYVAPDWDGRVDEYGNIILEKGSYAKQ